MSSSLFDDAEFATRAGGWEAFVSGVRADIPILFLLMPTGSREGPYRFYFYSHEPNEPSHIHVDRDDLPAKFWLDTVGLARNFRFAARELRRVQSLVEENRDELLEAWHGYFSTG